MAKTVISDLIKIFNTSVSAVVPDQLIKRTIQYNSGTEQLKILDENYNLKNKDVYLVGTGKAVQMMAREIESSLKSKIKSGIISIPTGSLTQSSKCGNVYFCEGAENNLPDVQAETTAKAIRNLATNLENNDILLVLISGGGSSLLPLPKAPITLEEKISLIKKLSNSGADIKELNTVRKRISGIKGGQLAILAHPAHVISLILSDIVGDPVDLIASGPTKENIDHSMDTLKIITKYKIYDQLPESIKLLINETTELKQFPKDKVENIIIGSNKLSIEAALHEATQLNYASVSISNIVTGNVKEVAEKYAKLTEEICNFLSNRIDKYHLKHLIKGLGIPGLDPNFVDHLTLRKKGMCLILGGEITVEVKGTGSGGRNQQLALEFSNCLHNMRDNTELYEIYLLSAGTDGIDGPTNAAGAIGYHKLIADAKRDNIDVQKYIDNNNSYNFYKDFMKGSWHIITGHTGTNVMDIHILVIKYK